MLSSDDVVIVPFAFAFIEMIQLINSFFARSAKESENCRRLVCGWEPQYQAHYSNNKVFFISFALYGSMNFSAIFAANNRKCCFARFASVVYVNQNVFFLKKKSLGRLQTGLRVFFFSLIKTIKRSKTNKQPFNHHFRSTLSAEREHLLLCGFIHSAKCNDITSICIE